MIVKGQNTVLEIDSEWNITINGIAAGDSSGIGLTTGDVNNDGVVDVIIGAWLADPDSKSGAGEAYVLFGPLGAGTIELSSDANITLKGVDGSDFSGRGLASGDLNDDGVDDLVVGAQSADPGGRVNAGETYVMFGPLVAGTLELSTQADLTINGVDGSDLFRIDVATGDVDNDGIEDLIIGGRGGDPGGRSLAGETRVVFGPLGTGTLELSTGTDLTVNGIDASDQSGIGVASGDVNHDGKDDLIIGACCANPGGRTAAGETYVLFGPLAAGTVELSTQADLTVDGIAPFDSSGYDVAVGDVNNDGEDDLIIGAGDADPSGRDGAGETYVVFGPLAAGTLELSTEADLIFNGIDAGDRSGFGVAIGDTNNDGAIDVIIGADSGDPGGRSNAGETYVVFGVPGAASVPGISVTGLAIMSAALLAVFLLVYRRSGRRSWSPTKPV